ncbi:hypothetical protein SEA_CECE_259 [Microbacterium phage Cece]|nr:hypothetical protein SEA_CECE_259 [Microbacterium phage Cece]
MSDYQPRDFYSPEAVRQVETVNALQSQLEMKYAQRLTLAGAPEVLDLINKGYKMALDDLTHAAGTMLAELYGQEKWGTNEAR